MPPRAPSGIAAVAAQAGVSIATVSRVMNGVPNKASADTVARVWEAVRALGYRPVRAGSTLRGQQSRLVAVLAANLGNPAMAAIVASMENALRGAGLVMALCDTHEQPALQDEYLLEMRAQRVQAICLLGAVASPALSALTEAGERLLFISRRHPDGVVAPFIGIDNGGAGRDVAGFFHARGIPDPGLIHASTASSATAGRVEGFCAAIHGPVRIAHGTELDHMALGYRHALDVLADRTRQRGIFCTSDLIAYGAHRRLLASGLRVPEDVLLVGFDDNPLNDWVAPWLTSVRVPYDLFGVEAVRLLHAMQFDQIQSAVLPHEMVFRAL
jgi:LacI family transcriptional regulator